MKMSHFFFFFLNESFLIFSKSKAGVGRWDSLFSLGVISVASVILACFIGSAVSYGRWRATGVKICFPILTQDSNQDVKDQSRGEYGRPFQSQS